MKRLLPFILFALPLSGISLPAQAQTVESPLAGAPTQYSVELLITPKSGTATIMHIYVDGNKRRTEQDTHNGELVVILRGDVHLMYTMFTERKSYRVNELDPDTAKILDISGLASALGISNGKIGSETIEGEPCDKYPYSPNAGKAGAQSVSSGFVWISQSTHLPVKSEVPGATTIWKIVNLGPQDPSLFQPPSDFKRID